MNLNQQLPDLAFDGPSRSNNRTKSPAGQAFNDLGIVPGLIKEINRLGFKSPTPIQERSIPSGIAGDDIIAIAQTGSGKTIGFGLPMLQRLSESKRGTGLVLVPTRELALQVEESLRAFGRAVHMRSAVLIGGASMIMQCKALDRTPRLIIATPGRLMDHIDRRTIDLRKLEVFVLDEADRMLDMGFLPDIKRIIEALPAKRQTMLFSATMPGPIETIAQQLMENPTRIEIDRSGATPAEVSHEIFLVENNAKGRLLAAQLENCSGPVLIFTRTKWMARKLTTKVNRMGYAAAEIHSNRTMGQRRSALEGFKRGQYQLLIATDIAARGIDVTGIELVVNYDMPANAEDYVHRVGRTGRAGKAGHAVSFANSDQKDSIRDIERFMKMKLTISPLPTLPSERELTQRAESSRPKAEPAGDRSSRRKDFKRGDSKSAAQKRREPREKLVAKPDSRRPESKSKTSKAKASKPNSSKRVDSSVGEAREKRPFWLRFKKSRPAKKKSSKTANKGKRRSRRK